jgi:hypothetical protein
LTSGSVTSEQCKSCHPAVYAEWQQSFHAQAYVDPEVRGLSNDYSNEQCIDCHAPRPIFETGIGKPPLPRSARRADGVDCISCHSRENTVVSANKGMTGACMPAFDPQLKHVSHCGSCHDQHHTVKEWKDTPFAAQGITCVSCHMQPVQRAGKLGASHASPASHDLAELKKAVSVTAEIKDRKLLVAVKNVGAGHHFPTDERSRAADLFVRLLDQEGALVEIKKLDRYRNPYRDEVGASEGLPFREEHALRLTRPESTLLPYGVERKYEYEIPAGKRIVELWLTYKTIPYPIDVKEILADEASFQNGKTKIIYKQEFRP